MSEKRCTCEAVHSADCRSVAGQTRQPTELQRAIGQALVQLNNELTVYLFGGSQGRAQVDALWAQREARARNRRKA